MIVTRHPDTGNIEPASATEAPSTKENVTQTGRIISTAIGATLLLKGLLMLEDRPVRSLLRLAAGGYLLSRGLTGYCPIADSLQQTAGKAEHLEEHTWE